ncbi:hypothetical protein OOZ19_10860 [Saccharopolyspora sp. NFXS83]|uniref:hypothetical protein n=1 Tax=Saccharopolyspora sp. NFXS83 TaxID=2993560 RepID=UPI00224AB352|nr:hypothetical protein [Saccharopolyspora sp. NFXS83]MCX2730742.1 hypothetical protein [Saccharopolyspora sp. NFXS83]
MGGVTASPTRNRQMLEFVARHGISAAVETFPVADVEHALDRVRRGAARYRVVLEL